MRNYMKFNIVWPADLQEAYWQLIQNRILTINY